MWDSVIDESWEIKSRTNGYRTRKAIYKVRKYVDDELDASRYIEFISAASDDEMMTPEMLVRMARYLEENKTLFHYTRIPTFVGGCMRFSNYIPRTLAWKAIDAIHDPPVQAFIALMAGGYPHYEVAWRLRLSEYDKESGVVMGKVKLPQVSRKYVDTWYDFVVENGASDDDYLFHKVTPRKLRRRITKRSINIANNRVKAKFGVDIYKYALIAYRMQRYNDDGFITIYKQHTTAKEAAWRSRQE